jgi:hypothetical protein
MQENLGTVSWQAGMDALEQVHLNCPWSAIYDMSNQAIYIAVHNNYDDISWVNLVDFTFSNILSTNEYNNDIHEKINISSFPNPFSEGTTLQFFLPSQSWVELSIYDLTGLKVITLIDKELQVGEHSVFWNGQNEAGHNQPQGIFIGQLVSNGQSKAIRLSMIDTSF